MNNKRVMHGITFKVQQAMPTKTCTAQINREKLPKKNGRELEATAVFGTDSPNTTY